LVTADGNVFAFTEISGALGKRQMGHGVARILDGELRECRFASIPSWQNADAAQQT